jgi:hypothetical protein
VSTHPCQSICRMSAGSTVVRIDYQLRKHSTKIVARGEPSKQALEGIWCGVTPRSNPRARCAGRDWRALFGDHQHIGMFGQDRGDGQRQDGSD